MATPAGVAYPNEIKDIDRQPDLTARTDNKGRVGTVANLPEIAYPVVVAEWARNSRESIRIALDQYQGCEIVDARAWWRDDEGLWRPGRSGLTLSVKRLPALTEGLINALRRARALGIVEPAINIKDKTVAESRQRYRQKHRNGSVTAS